MSTGLRAGLLPVPALAVLLAWLRLFCLRAFCVLLDACVRLPAGLVFFGCFVSLVRFLFFLPRGRFDLSGNRLAADAPVVIVLPGIVGQGTNVSFGGSFVLNEGGRS